MAFNSLLSACQTCRFRRQRDVHTRTAARVVTDFSSAPSPLSAAAAEATHAFILFQSRPGPSWSGARTRYVPRRRTMIRCCVRPTGGRRRRVVVAALAFSAYFHYSTTLRTGTELLFSVAGLSSFLSRILFIIRFIFFPRSFVRTRTLRELLLSRARVVHTL